MNDNTTYITAAQQWVGWDPNPTTRQEITQYIEANDHVSLKAAFQERIAFGTAGLRGAMKGGPAFMNELTVLQTAQGIAQYLTDQVPHSKERGIVIGYDGRHNSHLFAKRSVATFLSKGFKVYLFSEMAPTPLLAYSIRKLKTVIGIMVTASHNPKDDNGYKIYGENGAQIISPVDRLIGQAILGNLAPWDVDGVHWSDLNDPTEFIFNSYFDDLGKWSFFMESNKERLLKITYTAMHGVGAKSARLAFKQFHLQPFIEVAEQIDPDPEFPTVVFPNPEEGKGALKLAMETADRAGSPIIIANDPDADRLAAAEKTSTKDGEATWKIFTGDELGILLAHWIYTNYRQRNQSVDCAKLAVLNTTVSCKALAAYARHEGLYYEETLTGFKWLGNRAEQLEKDGYKLLFAYEEAIGYMIGTTTLDKDGITTAAVFAEMASHTYAQGSTLLSHLEHIYSKINYHVTNNRYFFSYDPKVTYAIFDSIRNGGNYFESCGKYKIKAIRDLKAPGYDSSKPPDNKPILPTSSSENLTLLFENGTLISLRGSGTEPKLKYYAQLSGTDQKATQELLNDVVQEVIHHFLQPEKHGILYPKD